MHCIRGLLPLLTFIVLGGCCGDSVGAVELSVGFPASSDRDSLVVGDTATVWAGAHTGLEWPSCVRYVSRATEGYTWPVRTDRFTFHSSDTTVARFAADGLLTALQAGETVLTATTQGVTSRGLLLTVSPDTASLGALPNKRLKLAARVD